VREPAASPTAGVAALIEAYREALEARDLAALRRIWPGLSGLQLTAIRDEFEHAARIEVALIDPRITVSGATATVTATRRYELATVDGQRLRTDSRTTLTARRRGDAWVIEDIRFDAP
jgi:ketosteroid isomerase-like protein